MKAGNQRTSSWLLVLAIWLLISCSSQEPVFFDIPQGNAAETLGEFASQSSIEIIFDPKLADQITTSRVYGNYTPDEALTRMLQGTPLTYAMDEKSGAIAVWKNKKNQ